MLLRNFFALLLIASIAGCAATNSQLVRVDDVPGDVEFTMLDVIGEGVIEQVKHHKNSDQEWYSVQYSNSGIMNEIFLTPNGTLLSENPDKIF